MTRSDKLSKSAGDMSSVLQGTRASPSPPKTSHSLTRASTASSMGNPLPLRGLKKDALLNTLEFSKVNSFFYLFEFETKESLCFIDTRCLAKFHPSMMKGEVLVSQNLLRGP